MENIGDHDDDPDQDGEQLGDGPVEFLHSDPFTQELLIHGMLTPEGAANTDAPPSDPAEAAHQQDLYERSQALNGAITLFLEQSADMYRLLAAQEGIPGEPLDHFAPLGVERFDGATVSAEEAAKALPVVLTGTQRVYLDYPHLVHRTVVRGRRDEPIWVTGVSLYYQDERGRANITVKDFGEMTVTFIGSDHMRKQYKYTVEDNSDAPGIRREAVAAPLDVSLLYGTESTAKVAERDMLRSLENERFSQEVRDLTHEPVSLVGAEEARFLHSLLAAAKPISIRHHEGPLEAVIARRIASKDEPDELHAAWAARELERMALEYANMHGENPQIRTYGGMVCGNQRMERTVTTHAVPKGSQPATFTARTEFTAPAAYVTLYAEHPRELTAQSYTVTVTTELSAAGNKVRCRDRLLIVGDDKSNPVDRQRDYDTADEYEVSMFNLMLYNSQ